MLICLVGVLLVVRSELQSNVNQCQCAEDIVGRAETSGLLEHSDVGGYAEQEQDDILDDGYVTC